MVTPESIHELLSAAHAALSVAVHQVNETDALDHGVTLSRLFRAQRLIDQVQSDIHRVRPDLAPALLPEPPDPVLDPTQQAMVDALTPAQLDHLDRTLLSHTTRRFRKVSLVVGNTLSELSPSLGPLPDVFYAMRVAHLVELGALEAHGDLRFMRHSEVRR